MDRSAACSLLHQGAQDGTVRGVTRISIPWCSKCGGGESINKASRRKAIKRRFQILSYQ